MKVKDFIKELQQWVEQDPEVAEREIIMSRDSEGNGFSPYADFSFQKYGADSTWSGDIYPDEPSEDEDADEWEAPEDAIPVIVLWPTN